MAESSTEKTKLLEKQKPAPQPDAKFGRIAHQVAGASASAGALPLDNAAITRIQRSPQHALRSDLLALQRAVGNRAVAAMVRGEAKEVSIQAKLQVGPVNDVYEREADHVARMVTSEMAQRKPAANVKSKDDHEEGEAEVQSRLAFTIKRMVQRKQAERGVRADGSFTTSAKISERLQRLKQGGRPLPDQIRRQMEPRFGADFGGVRIHTNSEAVQLSRDIGARAFTHGSHIAFGKGGFHPNSQAGRHLLAHELTHTIQQTGAQPLSSVQRSPKGTIQRGMLDRIRNWISGKQQEQAVAQVSSPLDPTARATVIQMEAFVRATKANRDADTLIATSNEEANQALARHTSTSDAMVLAGERTKLSSVKETISVTQRSDETIKAFIANHKESLTRLKEQIRANLEAVTNNNAMVTADTVPAKTFALSSHAIADQSVELVEKLREQAKDIGSRADTEAAFSRSGMASRWGRYEARSLPAAEKSASDSVLELIKMKGKVDNYYLYLTADFKTLEDRVGASGAKVTATYSETAAMRAMGAGMALANSEDDPGVLGDEQAMELAGSNNMQDMSPQDQTEEERSAQRKSDLVAGQMRGVEMMEELQQQYGTSHTAKPKLKKDEKKYAKRIKRLELLARLYTKAQKRLDVAEVSKAETTQKYEEANALYTAVDRARSEHPNPDQSIVNTATINAGNARMKVAEAAVHLEKIRGLKQLVYEESQKPEYKDLVGERAMSKSKRRGKKAFGMIAGPALRALTGGLYRVEAQDEAGGYRVGIKSLTLADDIVRKYAELKQLSRGIDGSHVRGLGGKHGARAYIAFKVISFALQIARDIFSAVGLWITLLTAGVGAPVGAIFASLALFAALAKAAIDLTLLIWSGAGLHNTNDPHSRAILRGENQRQGLAFSEGLFIGVGAGTAMAMSGQMGLLKFEGQAGAFGRSELSGHKSNLFERINDNWSQNVGGTEVYYGSMLRSGANVGIQSGVPALANIAPNILTRGLSPYATHASLENDKLNAQVDRVRQAKTALRVMAHPVRSAFGKLAEFATRKKRLRKSKFIALLPEMAKTIEDLSKEGEELPEEEGPEGSGPQGGGPQARAPEHEGI